MPEAIISAKGTEAPTVRSGRFTDSVLIYHVMTPPTKKTLKEINQLEGKRGGR